MNDRIDEAYQTKYAKSPYLKPMISDRARAATIMPGQNQAVAPGVSSTSSLSDSHAIKITRAGSQQSTETPVEHFTGAAKIELLLNDPSRAIGTSVNFQPGARTAWHTHPFGQTLLVISKRFWLARARSLFGLD